MNDAMLDRTAASAKKKKKTSRNAMLAQWEKGQDELCGGILFGSEHHAEGREVKLKLQVGVTQTWSQEECELMGDESNGEVINLGTRKGEGLKLLVTAIP